MSSIVKHKDKRTGITYVYESESYWDKEKQQPRSKRKLLGRLDEETGEVVPTDGRGRKRKDRTAGVPAAGDEEKKEDIKAQKVLLDTITEQEAVIKELKLKVSALQAEKKEIMDELKKLVDLHR